MSGSCKFRFPMECGEPLQSRWWIAQPLRRLSIWQSARVVRGGNRRAVASQGVKCKS